MDLFLVVGVFAIGMLGGCLLGISIGQDKAAWAQSRGSLWFKKKVLWYQTQHEYEEKIKAIK